MIWHSVKQFCLAGIKDILVITSTEHMGDIVNSLGSGTRFGCKFTYRVQEEAKGIAHALSLAEDFASNGKIAVLLGDNIFEYSIIEHCNAFTKQRSGARILLKEVNDPGRFGIAALDEKQIVQIEEKPLKPSSNYAVVGCYMYDQQVFEIVRGLTPGKNGEFGITTVNKVYLERGQLEYGYVQGAWMDSGTFESLQEANSILLKNSNNIL